MENQVIEAFYPLKFRDETARELGKHLKTRHSVVLIGMKRVGISNFLRYFINNKGIVKEYIGDNKKHLFIPVNLNDLVEIELYPFWILTFKRIVDYVNSSVLDKYLKREIEVLFLEAVQSNNLFLVTDGIRKSILKLIENNILPTIFFIRFDRVKDMVTPEFFNNLQGLKDAAHQKLTFVFTAYRSLDVLSPEVFRKASLSVFAQKMYLRPAKHEDIEIIFATYKNRYKLKISKTTEDTLFDIVDGYIQYLQLSMILLSENQKPTEDKFMLFDEIVKDERIALQSEELWESLTEKEKEVILKVAQNKKILEEEREKAKYLWNTGFILEKGGKRTIFSPLFDFYLKEIERKKTGDNNFEFTKKENLLFNFLKTNLNEVCDRDKIIEIVWPEVEALGVSDWAIDRLVARVRSKLKNQKSNYEIITVKTRGYKLATS